MNGERQILAVQTKSTVSFSSIMVLEFYAGMLRVLPMPRRDAYTVGVRTRPPSLSMAGSDTLDGSNGNNS